jgi:hypothetical protein
MKLLKNNSSGRPRSLNARSAFSLPEVLIASALGIMILTGTVAFMSFASRSLSGATIQTFLNNEAGNGMELILSRVRLATSITADTSQNTLTLGFDDNFAIDSNSDGKPYNDVVHQERFQFQNGDGNDNTFADNVIVYIPNIATTNRQTLLRMVRKLPNTPVFALTNLSTVKINLGVADTYASDGRQAVELQLIAVPRNRPAATNVVSILP